MATKIADAGAVTALFRIIDEYGDDEQLTTEAAKTLALLGVHEDLRRFYDNDVRFPAQVWRKTKMGVVEKEWREVYGWRGVCTAGG